MTVNYEVLLDWPDAASIGSAAERLAQYGTSFSDTFSSANSIWGRLGSCYETPHQGYLLTAFEPAVRDAESAAKGSAVAATEMGAFATVLEEYEPRRKQLVAEAEAFNLKGCPLDEVAAEEQRKEGEALQRQINELGELYRKTVTECVQGLSKIEGNGELSDPDSKAWLQFVGEQALGLGGAVADSIRLRTKTSIGHWTFWIKPGNNFLVRIMARLGKNCEWIQKLASWSAVWNGKPYTKSKTRLAVKAFSYPAGKTWWQRFGYMFRESLFGPKSNVALGPVTTKTAPGRTSLGVGRNQTSTVRFRIPTTAANVGRGLGWLGTGLTFASEYSRAQERYTTQEPHLSESERALKSTKTATVRTAGQAGTSAIAGAFAAGATGAAFGSTVPVAGTAVGFAVGLGVGLAQMIKLGDGKTVGEHIGDGVEGFWNGLKGGIERIGGLFG